MIAGLSLLSHSFAERFRQRVRAASASVTFDPGVLTDQHFLKYIHYRAIERFLSERFGDGAGIRAVELGGSNKVIKEMLPSCAYEIAPNYPVVDVQSMPDYRDGTYDLVVLDQILEHVRDPWRAVREVHRILKPGGICIATTPFLIQFHGYPDDYHRFTESGLRELFTMFNSVTVDSWGNRFTVKTIASYGWLSCGNTRAMLAIALWNEPEWPINFLTIATR